MHTWKQQEAKHVVIHDLVLLEDNIKYANYVCLIENPHFLIFKLINACLGTIYSYWIYLCEEFT
jgi:hypothetical protein